MIGGGIGGLAAALELRRAGLEVAVFEQHDGLAEVNTGLSLWAFAVRRLADLGLGGQLAEAGAPVERVVHRSVDGRLLGDVAVGQLSARFGVPSYDVHRAKLQRMLADALGADTVTFNRRCIGVHQSDECVSAEFEDGYTATADLLVGADGVHSIVRRAIPAAASTRLRRSEIGVWRGIATLAHDRVPPGLHLRVMGPATLFGIARLSDSHVRWYAGALFPHQRPSSGTEYKRTALDRFARWPPLVVDTLQQTAEADYLFNDTPHAAPLPAWGHGRITLLGDAAHSSVPTLGVSAGLAIEDAATLAECLRTAGSTSAALRKYEQRRRRISARVVRTARIFGHILMIHRQPAYQLREIGTRCAPQTLALRWLVGGATFR